MKYWKRLLLSRSIGVSSQQCESSLRPSGVGSGIHPPVSGNAIPRFAPQTKTASSKGTQVITMSPRATAGGTDSGVGLKQPTTGKYEVRSCSNAFASSYHKFPKNPLPNTPVTQPFRQAV